MSVALLGQVYDEVRRLFIAGSVVVPGDFRLKKLIAPLEQVAKKSPVLAKVLEGVKQLADAQERQAATALLELGMLINAILYTQGETSAEGKLEPLVPKDFGVHRTQTSARALKPILEALTSKGSGRLEIIKDAVDRNLFFDLRLVRPALLALDDGFPEIADLISKEVLPQYGTAILGELKSQFDCKGRGGAVRRLLLMHRLDPVSARDSVKQALDEGSKEVRVAAIECLGTDQEDLSFLLEHAKSKSKEVRAAAWMGLARMDAPDATNVLCTTIDSKEIENAQQALQSCRNATVTERLLAATEKQIELVIAGRTSDKKKLGAEVEKSLILLNCLRGRTDEGTEKLLLAIFARRGKLVAVKAEPSGADMMEQLVSVMAEASLKVKAELIQGHAELEVTNLIKAFEVARACYSPADVYQWFSPYLTVKRDKKKGKDPAFAKQEGLIVAITQEMTSRYHFGDFSKANSDVKPLDPRWLDLAINLDRLELIFATAKEGDEKSNQALAKILDQATAKGKKGGVNEWMLLATLARVKHPRLTEVILAAIERESKETYSHALYWFSRFLPILDKEVALPRLEGLIPKASKIAQDRLVDFIAELRR